MAITFVPTEIHKDAREIKGLPTDEKKRTSELAALRNALKRAEGSLVQRGGNAYACRTEAAANAVKDAVKVSGRGRSPKYDVSDIFSA